MEMSNMGSADEKGLRKIIILVVAGAGFIFFCLFLINIAQNIIQSQKKSPALTAPKEIMEEDILSNPKSQPGTKK